MREMARLWLFGGRWRDVDYMRCVHDYQRQAVLAGDVRFC